MATHQHVPPLVYSQLRMLAEAALGIPPGDTILFRIDPSVTDPTIIPGPEIVPMDPWPATGVLVPARHKTKFPDPGEVVIQVDGANGTGVNAVDHRADALFWSDAAVQKFVLPYYTSCMGYEAYDRLAGLQQAWNGNHPGIVVLALMHVTGVPVAPTGPAAQVEPFRVVYLQEDENQVKSKPLSEFGRDHPATLPPLQRPAPHPYVAPDLGTGIPYPDYISLRSMAEWGASVHTETRYFWYHPEEGRFHGPSRDYESDGHHIVIPVLNPFVPADRLGSRTLTVTFGGATLGADVDAVFWSTGAIEQFLMPYYASIDGFNGLEDLYALKRAWQDNIPTLGGNRLEGGTDVPIVGLPDGEVMGILHFLRSMFETEEAGSTTLRRELGLANTDGAGAVQIIRAAGVTVNAA